MKGRETSVSDSSACVSDSANEDNFYRDQDELANSELYFCTSYLMMKISSPVPTCSHIEYDTVEKADAEPFRPSGIDVTLFNWAELFTAPWFAVEANLVAVWIVIFFALAEWKPDFADRKNLSFKNLSHLKGFIFGTISVKFRLLFHSMMNDFALYLVCYDRTYLQWNSI